MIRRCLTDSCSSPSRRTSYTGRGRRESDLEGEIGTHDSGLQRQAGRVPRGFDIDIDIDTDTDVIPRVKPVEGFLKPHGVSKDYDHERY